MILLIKKCELEMELLAKDWMHIFQQNKNYLLWNIKKLFSWWWKYIFLQTTTHSHFLSNINEIKFFLQLK